MSFVSYLRQWHMSIILTTSVILRPLLTLLPAMLLSVDHEAEIRSLRKRAKWAIRILVASAHLPPLRGLVESHMQCACPPLVSSDAVSSDAMD